MRKKWINQVPSLGAMMEVSKWLQIQVLLDASEVNRLFEALGEFSICRTGIIESGTSYIISKSSFSAVYTDYVTSLKNCERPDPNKYRALFSSVLTRSSDVFKISELSDGRQLVKVIRPVVQLQMHRMSYSSVDHKFRPMIHGENSIYWGLQFSYPQLFMDPDSLQPVKIDESESFPNTHLFRQVQKWIRKETVPTPFVVNGKQINVPMRLGKECLSWISRHPQLESQKIGVRIQA